MCGLYSFYGGALLGISCMAYVSILGSCIVQHICSLSLYLGVPPSLFSVMDVSDIIIQVVTTAGVEKMKQSVVVVMVWYTLCCAGLAFCWIFPRGSVGFSSEVYVPLWVSSRVFTLGGMAMPP